MIFKDTDKWRVSVQYFDPAYWSIIFRVRHKPTGKWTYGRTTEAYPEKIDYILLDRELEGTSSLSLSPEDRHRLQLLFEEFEERAMHPRTFEQVYPNE